jgi:acyl carrier protein
MTITPTATPTAQDEMLERLRDIVTDVLEIEPGELTDTSSFTDDHDADSLLTIEILARIERDLGVDIPQEELPEMTSLTAVHSIVARYAGWEDTDA